MTSRLSVSQTKDSFTPSDSGSRRTRNVMFTLNGLNVKKVGFHVRIKGPFTLSVSHVSATLLAILLRVIVCRFLQKVAQYDLAFTS